MDLMLENSKDLMNMDNAIDKTKLMIMLAGLLILLGDGVERAYELFNGQ